MQQQHLHWPFDIFVDFNLTFFFCRCHRRHHYCRCHFLCSVFLQWDLCSFFFCCASSCLQKFHIKFNYLSNERWEERREKQHSTQRWVWEAARKHTNTYEAVKKKFQRIIRIYFCIWPKEEKNKQQQRQTIRWNPIEVQHHQNELKQKNQQQQMTAPKELWQT